MATSVGGYAIFAGGCDDWATSDWLKKTVDVYDASLTRQVFTSLSLNSCRGAATTIGNYALFGGGLNDSGSAHSVVDAYTVA